MALKNNKQIICYCKNITKETIIKTIEEGAKNLKEIQQITTACTGNKCEELNPKKKCCSIEIIGLLKENKQQTTPKCNC